MSSLYVNTARFAKHQQRHLRLMTKARHIWNWNITPWHQQHALLELSMLLTIYRQYFHTFRKIWKFSNRLEITMRNAWTWINTNKPRFGPAVLVLFFVQEDILLAGDTCTMQGAMAILFCCLILTSTYHFRKTMLITILNHGMTQHFEIVGEGYNHMSIS